MDWIINKYIRAIQIGWTITTVENSGTYIYIDISLTHIECVHGYDVCSVLHGWIQKACPCERLSIYNLSHVQVSLACSTYKMMENMSASGTVVGMLKITSFSRMTFVLMRWSGHPSSMTIVNTRHFGNPCVRSCEPGERSKPFFRPDFWCTSSEDTNSLGLWVLPCGKIWEWPFSYCLSSATSCTRYGLTLSGVVSMICFSVVIVVTRHKRRSRSRGRRRSTIRRIMM